MSGFTEVAVSDPSVAATPLADSVAATPPPAANSWEFFNDRQRWLLVIVLFLVSSSGAIDRAIIAILLEPIKLEFHVSDTALGLLSGVAFGTLYAILGVPLGRYADRGDRRLLITASIGLWSILTTACGWVGSFLQLFLLRIGVGIGEAGGTGPPVMSLIADYFPPERRAKAIGFVQMSMLTGAVLGLMVGGYVAQYFGWRTTMIVSGLPGLVLAAIAWFALREPRALAGYPVPHAADEGLMDALRALIRKPTFVNATLAFTVFNALANGPLTFDAAYVIRDLHVGIADSGFIAGLVDLVTVVAGSMIGGVLADRLSKRNITWLCKLPGYGMLMIFPFYAASHLVPTLMEYTILSSIAGTIMFGVLTAIIASILAVVGAKRRATGYAIMLMVSNLVGVTLGPVVTGLLSDRIGHWYGPEQGLRWAIIITLLAFYPTGWFMLRAARTIHADYEI
ncbi:MAG TPA: MFS transporter [Steroidobacteraceae bacterium]